MSLPIRLIHVSPENLDRYGLFCIKNKKAPGYLAKAAWFKENYPLGLRLILAEDGASNPLGFIEYVPAEQAWRPVQAGDYLFIHCLMVHRRDIRGQGVGTRLLEAVEEDARQAGKKGVCVMCSEGAWIARKELFLKNGYQGAERRGRFELLYKSFLRSAALPKLIPWEEKGKAYSGWHLLYAHQCPWHEKSVQDLQDEAKEQGIDLRVKKLESSQEARAVPSGFGTFALLHDGTLLADHYISRTRFRNILKKELKTSL